MRKPFLSLIILLLLFSFSRCKKKNIAKCNIPAIVPFQPYSDPVWHPNAQLLGFNHTPLTGIEPNGTAPCIQSNAQVDTSTTQKLLQYIFQPIDKSQIPTGYLEEYGCPMVPMATFNSTLTDSNRIDMHLWRTLYLQLQTGWTRATANPSLQSNTFNNWNST